jgi:HD-GYP domain-containing protein (c-di-GMP phosphodiesterase class II)
MGGIVARFVLKCRDVSVAPSEFRLAELMATLSRASDLANGATFEQSLASAVVAARLAEAAGMSEEEARDAYYLTMLRTVGCTGDGDLGRIVLGEDVGTWITHLPNGSPVAMMAALVTHVGRDKTPGARASAVARAFGSLPRVLANTPTHCELGKKLAERLGLGPVVARGLEQMFERWDGGGQPRGLKRDELEPAVCIAHVATDAQVMRALGGRDAAVAMVRGRKGKGYAPKLVEALVRDAAAVLDDGDDAAASPWDAALAAEPGRPRRLAGDEAERAIRAIGEYADLKSGYFRGHSAGVSALAAGAARRLRLPEGDVQALARAGHLHDLGRASVLVDVWEKKGPLTEGERERIRSHAYDTERILARAAFLGPAAAIASQDHERLDGSGYHRRLPPVALPVTVRVLAAADVFRALLEPRPHRPARKPDEAAHELRHEARSGHLDAEAVEAVLGAAGQQTRPAPRAGGLSEREVEVLRQVARGLTNKEIAVALDISVKTAGHHVEHIFQKIGVTTRAAAGLYAMQNDLMT